jgi:Double zinc ribbon
MLPLAYFGIESNGLNLVIDLLILFLAVLYLSLIYWTYADARRRIIDPMLIGCATAASLFPFVGTIVYLILRPPEYLEDVRERELEMQAAEARLHDLDQGLCPHCDYRVERDFIRCPSCLRKLKERCVNCSRPLDQAWTICPYCEAEVPGVVSPRARRRRTPPLDSESLLAENDRPEIRGAAAAGAGPGVEEDRAESVRPTSTPRGAGRARRPRPTS